MLRIVTIIAIPTRVMLSVLQVNKLRCFAGLDIRQDRIQELKSV